MTGRRMLTTLGALIGGGIAVFTAFDSPAEHPSTERRGDLAPYRGLCDASAVEALDANLFAVANDEDNVLRIYDRLKVGLPVQ